MHPLVEPATTDLDFAAVYGGEWGISTGAAPQSSVLAAGSAVRVLRPT